MLRLIAKLGTIPIGSSVTKIGGTKKYLVRDRLDIYKENGDPEMIYANDGCLYLVGPDGSINAFGFEKELVWHTDLETLNNIEE